MKRKYNLLYWEHYSSVYEIAANSVEEAIETLKNQVYSGELGDINDLEFDDYGVEVVDEVNEKSL